MNDEPPYICLWESGDSHESMYRIHCPSQQLTITIEHRSFHNEAPFKLWLVNTLKVWPHPDAPKFKNEYNYPEYRSATYDELIQNAKK